MPSIMKCFTLASGLRTKNRQKKTCKRERRGCRIKREGSKPTLLRHAPFSNTRLYEIYDYGPEYGPQDVDSSCCEVTAGRAPVTFPVTLKAGPGCGAFPRKLYIAFPGNFTSLSQECSIRCILKSLFRETLHQIFWFFISVWS